jgi:hypothetical protein
MKKTDKKFRELQGKLTSGNEKVISDAIISVRDDVPFNGAIGLLTQKFDETNNLIIKEYIRNFLNDIKNPEVRPELIDEIIKPYKPETTSMLVSSCWQSGIDYSEFVMDFTGVFIKGDYLTALECFTVIEESAMDLSEQKKNEIISLLKKNNKNFTVEKNALSEALIDVLL